MGRKKRKERFLAPSSNFGTLSPWDRGVLEAHWMHSVRTQKLRELQVKVTRQRGGFFAWIWPARRHYLDGLLHGLAGEIKRRSKGDSSEDRLSNPTNQP
ncbi:hypothetical protein V5E97_22670 [Singulisphaera sp. Ch08]|uniref:Uncharacterized protein n=1 Tax=Singulisphaera sp. Ch08 TaxID=3120278 RepID=A0AAU7C7N5_9BACT